MDISTGRLKSDIHTWIYPYPRQAWIFQREKMFKPQHQFNNIVETSQTTQLTNDQMPKFHCHCECSKCPPTAPSSKRIFHFHFKAHCAYITVKYEWPPNSPGFNHLTTNVCGAMPQTFCKPNLKPKTILELKVVLQQIRKNLLQTFANRLNGYVLWPVVNILNIRYELFKKKYFIQYS